MFNKFTVPPIICYSNSDNTMLSWFAGDILKTGNLSDALEYRRTNGQYPQKLQALCCVMASGTCAIIIGEDIPETNMSEQEFKRILTVIGNQETLPYEGKAIYIAEHYSKEQIENAVKQLTAKFPNTISDSKFAVFQLAVYITHTKPAQQTFIQATEWFFKSLTFQTEI